MGTIEVKNARIVDVENGKLYPEDARMMIKDNTLVIGVDCGGMKPDSTVDFGGRYICPSLFNVHAHVFLQMPTAFMDPAFLKVSKEFSEQQLRHDMELSLKNGITHVRDGMTENLPVMKRLMERLRGGEWKGPRIYRSIHIGPSGGTFVPEQTWMYRTSMAAFGQPVMKYGDPNNGVLAVPVDADRKILAEAVTRAVALGADYIKLYADEKKKLSMKDGAKCFDENQIRIIVEEAKKHRLNVHMHHLSVRDFEQGIRAGVRSLAHIPIDRELTEQSVALLASSNTMIEPTLSLAYTYAFDAAGEGNRWIDWYQRETREEYCRKYWIEPFQDYNRKFFDRVDRRKFKVMGFMELRQVFERFVPVATTGFANVKKIIAAGLSDRIAIGTDAGAMSLPCSAIEVEFDLIRRCYEELGVSAERACREILAMATINSARSMGLEDRYGSLRTGKAADFIVLESDPLLDPNALKSPIRQIYKDGQPVVRKGAA